MVASVQQPWKFQLPTLAFLDGPVGVGVDEEEVVVVMTAVVMVELPEMAEEVVVVMTEVVMVELPEMDGVVEVEETGSEVVDVVFATSSLYTLRRDGPPQYSVELSTKR